MLIDVGEYHACRESQSKSQETDATHEEPRLPNFVDLRCALGVAAAPRQNRSSTSLVPLPEPALGKRGCCGHSCSKRKPYLSFAHLPAVDMTHLRGTILVTIFEHAVGYEVPNAHGRMLRLQLSSQSWLLASPFRTS